MSVFIYRSAFFRSKIQPHFPSSLPAAFTLRFRRLLLGAADSFPPICTGLAAGWSLMRSPDNPEEILRIDLFGAPDAVVGLAERDAVGRHPGGVDLDDGGGQAPAPG